MPSQVTPIGRRLGSNIRKAREEFGWSQRELAYGLNVSSQDISRYERGVVRPSDERLVILARLLDRDVGWFYSEPDPDLPAAA